MQFIEMNKIFTGQMIQREYADNEPYARIIARRQECIRIYEVYCDMLQCYNHKLDAAFTRWFLMQKMMEPSAQSIDPIIPAVFFNDPKIHRRLHGANFQDVLQNECRSALSFLTNLTVNEHLHYYATVDQMVTFQFGDAAFRLDRDKYTDLRRMWHGKQLFDDDVFRLVARYETLPIGDSYQAAVPPPVFRFLRTCMGVTHECFASPLNRSMEIESFTGAYPDVDTPFGSLGDFWQAVSERKLWEHGGSFEANPPFIEDILYVLAKTVLFIISATTYPISFVLVLPDWQDTPAIELLRSQHSCKRSFCITRDEHVYLCGTQYHPVRDRQERLVHYCNSYIIVSQNEVGSYKWPFGEREEREMRSVWSGVATLQYKRQRI